MKSLYLWGVLLFLPTALTAQQAEDFLVEIEEIQVNNSPGVQSFVHAEFDNKWLIMGGRTDGLHRRQPWAAFLSTDNNVMAYVVDPLGNQTYAANLNTLPTGIYEQIQSTNMEFEQRDSTLYIVGGYGFSATANDHITYPNLIAVDVPGLMNAIINSNVVQPYFRQITDTALQVTGGYMDRLGDTYYLAGGQMFEGSYNPMGPTHGPGFVQEYTNAIRKFEIIDNGTTMSLANYQEVVDTVNLHRRDYNMAVQMFPDGTTGFTMFSGVFQHTVDLPWLNTVDVRDTGYWVRPAFNQYLNQYHTAHMPVRDGAYNAMHTVFFGGISRYTKDASGQLVDDTNVPFVNTISMTTRYSDDSMTEFKLGELPALLGSGAEFIPVQGANFMDHYDIIHLDSLPYSKTLVGYVVGGIESSQANIFFINDGTQSDATTRIFEVYITRGITGIEETIDGEVFFDAMLYPNPSDRVTTLEVKAPHEETVTIYVSDAAGKRVQDVYQGSLTERTFSLETDALAAGFYQVVIENSWTRRSLKLVVEH